MGRRAFTLIELLVVLAIVTMLMAVLLPSLARARQQTREVVCRSNMRQLAVAFASYSAEWKDYLPGNCFDYGYDWLGTGNFQYGVYNHAPSAPEKGIIFPYAGRSPDVYRCPDPKGLKETALNAARHHSYTMPLLLTGSTTTMIRRALYEDPPAPGGPDWRAAMVSIMPPVLCEEDADYSLAWSIDGGWSNTDAFTNRHAGRAHVGFADGHVEIRRFPRPPVWNAWRMYYEMVDRRLVTAGPGFATMGYLRTAPSVR